MPIYVYEREDGTCFEKIQKLSDDPLTVCPDTGQKVTKKISATTPIFKGTGFYKTDYCNNNSQNGSDSSSKPKSSSKKGCGSTCGCH